MTWTDSLRRLLGRPAVTTGPVEEPAAQPVDNALPAARWIVVGLGNPGATYAATRHNIGYLVVDELLSRHGASLTGVPGAPAAAAVTGTDDGRALLVRSTTFMNESGLAVAPLAASLRIAADHIIVVHDELDLPAGTVRVKLGGNENGHNGLKSVSEQLGTRDYVRVRVGIGRPDPGQGVVDHVLEPLQPGSPVLTVMAQAASTAADAAEIIVTHGIAAAQNEIHGRRA